MMEETSISKILLKLLSTKSQWLMENQGEVEVQFSLEALAWLVYPFLIVLPQSLTSWLSVKEDSSTPTTQQSHYLPPTVVITISTPLVMELLCKASMLELL